MAKQTALETVKDHMRELQELKATDLETITQKQKDAREQLEAAELAMRRATEVMDVDAYEEAEKAKQKARTLLSMYTGRAEQIRQQEYISETESDKAIDSLLEYENELATEFRTAIAAPLKKLAQLHAEYTTAIKDTEETLSAWQRDIRANYSTRGQMTRIDEVTGLRTDKSITPVPVHRLPYEGCWEAAQLGDYLKKAAPLYME